MPSACFLIGFLLVNLTTWRPAVRLSGCAACEPSDLNLFPRLDLAPDSFQYLFEFDCINGGGFGKHFLVTISLLLFSLERYFGDIIL